MTAREVVEDHLARYQQALSEVEQRIALKQRMLSLSDPDWDGPLIHEQLLSLLTREDALIIRVNTLRDVLVAIKREGTTP